MTPDKLSEVEFRARNARDFPTVNDAKDCLFIASAKSDVLDVCASLRTAWAERDKLNVLLDERADKTDALLADHAMREASLLAERDARPDEATVAKVREVLTESLTFSRDRDWRDGILKAFKLLEPK